MKLKKDIAVLFCAAMLTGCGTTANNENSLRIEVQTANSTVAVSNSPALSSSAPTASETTVSVSEQSLLTSSTSSMLTTTTVLSMITTTEAAVSTIPATASETMMLQTETKPETEAPVPTAAETVPTTASAATTVTTPTTIAAKTTAAAAKQSLFQELMPGKDCTAYIKSHTDYTKQEDVSCHGEGTDRVYTYADYTVYTFFHDGTDEVWELVVSAPGIALDTGIEVGMTKADVIAKYGISDDDSYKDKNSILTFFYNDADQISEISLMQPDE